MHASPIRDPAQFPSAFDEALNSGELDRLLRLYEPLATFRRADGAIQQGPEALRRELGELISAQARLHNVLRHVLRSGETALLVVDWRLTLEVPGAGTQESSGTATNVLRHDAEEGWRMLIANPQGVA